MGCPLSKNESYVPNEPYVPIATGIPIHDSIPIHESIPVQSIPIDNEITSISESKPDDIKIKSNREINSCLKAFNFSKSGKVILDSDKIEDIEIDRMYYPKKWNKIKTKNVTIKCLFKHGKHIVMNNDFEFCIKNIEKDYPNEEKMIEIVNFIRKNNNCDYCLFKY